MPFKRFGPMVAVGSIPWVVGLAVLGREVGHGWQSWRHDIEYRDYVGVAIVVLEIAYLMVRRGGLAARRRVPSFRLHAARATRGPG